MYLPTGGYRSRRSSYRFQEKPEAGIWPCSQGSIEQGVFNTESYGEGPGLEIVEYAGE